MLSAVVGGVGRYVLPQEYVAQLSSLFDQAPTVPTHVIEQVGLVRYSMYGTCCAVGKRASVGTRVRSRVRACINAYPHHCIDRSLSAAGRRAGTGCAGSSSNSREHGR
jgi:hypothetical protein